MTTDEVLALPGSAVEFPNLHCVYFLVNARGEVAYVGATKNLCKRMLSHSTRKTGSWRVCHWLPVRRDKTLLRTVEAHMIRALKPLCNERRPTPASEVNYPPRNEQEALDFVAEESERKKGINVVLSAKAHMKLKVLCAAWMMTQGEALSFLLENYDISKAVEQMR